jgi:hypothetical protein
MPREIEIFDDGSDARAFDELLNGPPAIAATGGADETLVFLLREAAKRARGNAGDETLVWLIDAAVKRARGRR